MDPWRVSLNAQGRVVALVCTVLLAWAAGCAGPRSQHVSELASHRDVNQQLASVAARGPGFGVISDYRIGSGDVVEIDVFQADELDRTVRVRPDGTISFPFLGIFSAAGQTTAELEGTLTARLEEKYLNDPQISVFVKEYRALLSEPGAMTAALNWYRALDPAVGADVGEVALPVLYIFGNRDMPVYVGEAPRSAQEKWLIGPHRSIELDADHWLIEERREAVVSAILEHLRSAAPAHAERVKKEH